MSGRQPDDPSSEDAFAATREGPPTPSYLAIWSPPTQVDEFILQGPLGNGAMGMVFLAEDTILKRKVALKFISPTRLSADARARFLIEAQALARLNHPNIATLYRTGTFAGYPYLVSEFVAGRSLDQAPIPIDSDRVLELARALARGLCAAHERGVLHRDVKPANIILTDGDHVKLVDFGLAKLASEVDAEKHEAAPAPPSSSQDEKLTQAGSLMGTPSYMAPEAWRGEPATERTDIYSLGAVMYELCSGELPYTAKNIAKLGTLMQEQDAPPLSLRASNVAPALAAIVDRCLRRDPTERFASSAALCQALDAAANRSVPPAPRRSALVFTLVLIPLLGLGLAVRYRGRAQYARLPPQAGHSVHLPGGTLRMGSTPLERDAAYTWCTSQPGDSCDRALFAREQPLRRVRLSPYRIDATEVTNSEFARWLNAQRDLRLTQDQELHEPRYVFYRDTLLLDLYPSFKSTQGLTYTDGRYQVQPGFDHKPVTQITWDGAWRYCEARGMRLPTEAEWEFAARGEERRRFPWGHEDPRCEGVVFGREPKQRCAGLGGGALEVGTSPQDRTPTGVYDLAGNVAEWVMDRFAERYPACEEPCLDPAWLGVGSGLRVVRGGSWSLTAVDCRAALRSRRPQGQAFVDVGFRCAAPAAS